MIIVDQGKCVYDGSVATLRDSLVNKRKVTIEFASNHTPINWYGANLISDEGIKKVIEVEKHSTSIFEWLQNISNQCPIADFSMKDPDIEDVIRELYRQLNEQSGTHKMSNQENLV